MQFARNSACLFLILLPILTRAQSIPGAVVDGSATTASFSITLSADNGASFQAQAGPTDSILVGGTINPESSDIGRSADLFSVMISGGEQFVLTQATGFQLWDGTLEGLVPAVTDVTLSAALPFEILRGEIGQETDLSLYIAYQVVGTNRLIYSSTGAHFSISNSAQSTDSSPFYTPAPIVTQLQAVRSVDWSTLTGTPGNLTRFAFGPHNSTDVVLLSDAGYQINESLTVVAGLAAEQSLSDDVLLRTLFKLVAEDAGGYRIVSSKHSNYVLDVDSLTNEIVLRDFRSSFLDDERAGYLVFDVESGASVSLIAARRMRYNADAISFESESGFSQQRLEFNNGSIRLGDSGTALTFYQPGLNLDIPGDFNPQLTARVSNSEATPIITDPDDRTADVPNQVDDSYATQLSAPGVDGNTRAAAESQLQQIQSDLQQQGADLRYPVDFYMAFRDGLLSRLVQSADAYDGVLGQLAVPYVFFTNATDDDGNRHPFMVIASYGIPDSQALLWDVPRPPGGDCDDGSCDPQDYNTQPVTRSYHREAFLMKIPLRDYGVVSSLTENTMLHSLASDVGETLLDHHNYASVSATGVAVDGVIVYPSLNNSLNVAQTAAELSARGMHSGRGLGVHYHADAHSASGAGLNLYNASDYQGRTHPPIVSMGFDGVAGYGVYQPGDISSDGVGVALDEYGGHDHGEYSYHYHSYRESAVSNQSTEYTIHTLPPQGAWAGRINDIPEFWDQRAPNYVGGRSRYLGTD